MTTEELLWNATFENYEDGDNSYNYDEEWNRENYYEDKELFERYKEYFRPTG